MDVLPEKQPHLSRNAKLRRHADQRRTAMKNARQPWIQDWRQVSEYIDPARGRFDGDATNTEPAKRSRSKIINSRATYCVRVATAGLSSHMTSKARPWFNLTTPDPAMGQQQEVKVWLDQVTTIIRDTLAKSNFYKAMPVLYTEDLMYGVAAMLIVENAEEVARFHPLTCGTYAISLNDAGRVDSLWRCYIKTARQLVEKYGIDHAGLTETVKNDYRNNRGDTKYVVESLIEPNPDARPGIGPLGLQRPEYRPYRELVWLWSQSGEYEGTRGMLDIGGHYEAPFVCIRFNPVGDEEYSACPGTDALGDIKQLQYQEGQKLKLGDLMAEPPVNIPESMRSKGASMSPRAKNYVPDGQLGMKVEATYSPNPNAMQYVMADIEAIQNRIGDAFYYNLFLMLESLGDAASRTATEIAERKEEKAAVLGPTLEIVTDEGLDPTVVRVYRLLERAGRIPPPPEVLRNIPIKIEYTSILAQAMKAAGTSGIERTAGFVAQMAQVGGPSVLDKFDFDQAVDEYSERTGIPASIIRDDDAVQAMREERQTRENQQAALAAAQPMQQAAQALKTLGEAQQQEGSIGQGIAEQLGGGVAA